MNYQVPGQSRADQLKWMAVFLLLMSIIFHWRVVSSGCIGLLVILNILSFNSRAWARLPREVLAFVFGLAMLYILNFVSFFYSENQTQALANLRIQLGLLLIPLAILPLLKNKYFSATYLLKSLLILISVSGIYLIVMAGIRFQFSGDVNEFFYHQLVSPFNHHAIYFSLLVLIALIILLESIMVRTFFIHKLFHFGIFLLLSALLFMLSSKLILILFITYLLWLLFDSSKATLFSRRSAVACCVTVVTAGMLLLSTRNPVSSRFAEISHGSMQLIKKDQFSRSDYFNGLQFRLLQWRFVGSILTEQGSWIQGVGIGDAQDRLKAKYIQSNMYTGDGRNDNQGYLIYNTHNQWLETILQTGIIGLLALILISMSLIHMALKYRTRGYSMITLSLLLWLFTESVFETQYGIVIFSLFPLLIIITGTTINKQTGTNS